MFVKYMLGVLKNLLIQRKKSNLIKVNLMFAFVFSREYTMNSDDIDDFTVYLKTLVTFGLFNITLLVFICIL
jgi:hypothetical protein